MLNLKWRGKAAGLHLAGSAVVAALAAALVFLLWYPWPFTALAGGLGLFLLLTGVDVVMGPLITFAVVDRRKPLAELRRDLAIVVALQIAALGYGLYVMYSVRPVVMALESSRFRVVSANDVPTEALPLAPPELRQLSWGGPITVRTVVPTDSNEQFEAIAKALGGADIGTQPKYWRAWDDAGRQEAKTHAKPLGEIRQRYAARAAELNAAIAKTGQPEAGLGYLPILSRHADWIALIDKGSGAIVGYAPFDAYQ